MSSAHLASQSVGPVAEEASAACAGEAALQERLAEQLHTLTQVVETITYRLLEVEERLAEQESQLNELHQRSGAASELSDGAEHHVDETEERLVRLESLLHGMDAAASGITSRRHLQSVVDRDQVHGAQDEEACIDGPFLEEPEQPFMDELQAFSAQSELEVQHALEDLSA